MPARKVCERDSERSGDPDWNCSLAALAVVQTSKCSLYPKVVQPCSGALHNLKAVSAH